MKRFIAILLAATMVFAMAACAAKTTTSTSASASAPATNMPAASASASSSTAASASAAGSDQISGKLTIWEHNASFEEALKAVIEGFNEKYPNVEVEYSIKTSDQYYNLLQTAMQAGECPDLFWTNGKATTNYESYVDQGLMMDLTDKVDFSLYDGTSAMDIVTLDGGKIYSTPTAEIGGRAVFYNKDIFDENGWTIPKTFTEFEDLLGKISKTNYIPVSFGATDPWNVLFVFEPILAAMHLDWIQDYSKNGYVEVNDPRVVEAYNKLIEWGDKGYYGNNWTGVSGDGMSLAFSTGEAAMYIGGTWNISTFQENNPDLNFGAFQIPCEDGQVPFVSTNSCGFGISSKTENPDAAIAFANYFASQDGQSKWLGALGSISCSTKIVSDSDVVNDVQNSYTVQAESYYNILGYEAGTGDSPCNLWEEDQCKILTGGMSVQDFVDELQALCLTQDQMAKK